MTEHQKKLGFDLEPFIVYDGFDEGFMYYDDKGNCFYTVPEAEKSDWWNAETMEIQLDCPFCDSSVGGFFKTHDATFVKKWMGKHLALNHRIEVEKYLIAEEQREEYAGFYC